MLDFVKTMDPFVAIWLILGIVFVVVELMTVGLTSIWFAAGAVAALLAAALGAPVWVQIGLVIGVSGGLLFATKPWVTKHINAKTVRTNADRTVGKRIIIAETVDNVKQTGMAVVDGQEWTVRAEDESEVIPIGASAEVVGIKGVKLIVKKL